jgi:hypothetical protein
MDPLSITVAIPALAGMAAELVWLINKSVQAHEHILKHLSDVQRFRNELDILLRHSKHPQIAPHLPEAHYKKVLDDAQLALHELVSILRKVSSENRDQIRVQLSWIKYERRCREHHRRLSECLEKLKALRNMVIV